jgi:hypothetical protein
VPSEDRYRLAKVADLRARDERIRRGDLAVAVGDARETEARVEAARARTAAARTALAAAIAARDELTGTTTTTRDALTGTTTTTRDALVRAEQFITRRRGELERALGEELRAEAAHDARLGSLDEARRRLARARADREIIERHFARWREARKRLADRRED